MTSSNLPQCLIWKYTLGEYPTEIHVLFDHLQHLMHAFIYHCHAHPYWLLIRERGIVFVKADAIMKAWKVIRTPAGGRSETESKRETDREQEITYFFNVSGWRLPAKAWRETVVGKENCTELSEKGNRGGEMEKGISKTSLKLLIPWPVTFCPDLFGQFQPKTTLYPLNLVVLSSHVNRFSGLLRINTKQDSSSASRLSELPRQHFEEIV